MHMMFRSTRLLRAARPLARSRFLCTTASESDVKVSVVSDRSLSGFAAAAPTGHHIHRHFAPRPCASCATAPDRLTVASLPAVSPSLPRHAYTTPPPQTDEHTGELFSLRLDRSGGGAAARAATCAKIQFTEPEVTAEDVAFFNRHGYFMPAAPMIDAAGVAALREEFGRIFEGQVDYDATPPEFEFWCKVVDDHRKGSAAVRKVNNSWWVNAGMRKVTTSPAIGKVAGRLLGTDTVRLWHDQAIWKPGTLGRAEEDAAEGNIGWHQDYGFWQVSDNSDQMCTAFVALQDMDMSNGAMRTIAGSHKWGLLDDSAMFFEKVRCVIVCLCYVVNVL